MTASAPVRPSAALSWAACALALGLTAALGPALWRALEGAGASWQALGLAVLALALRQALGQGAQRLAGRQRGGGTPMPREQAVKEVRDAATYLEVMRTLLACALKDAESGAQGIIERMNAVHRVSTEQAQRIESTEANSHQLGVVVKDKLMADAQLGSILQMFVEKQEADLHANLERIKRLQGVKDLTALVDDIATVARQTNFLSINAAIEAARAGETGRGFAVVAAEIRQLSNRTAALAVDIADKISRATAGIDEEMQAAETVSGRNTTTGNMRRVLDDIRAMQQRFAESMQKLSLEDVVHAVRSGHQDIADRLADAMGHVQVQDVTRQRVESVQLALNDLDNHLQAMADQLVDKAWDPASLSNLREKLQQQTQHYVMHSQRDAHARVTGQMALATGGAEPKIELF
ncbi:MAG: methyl-accepting chemotaxis protein [Aquabacterium sp.]|nr:methyl-accepting chemotaxis protein [Aquabacterium sp.]